IPIDSNARHVIGCSAVGNVLDAAMIMSWGGFGVAVVLGDKNDGQLPDGSEVKTFVQGSLFGGSVTEKTNSDLISLVHLGRQARTAGQWWSAPDNPISSEHAFVHISDMHGATFALTGPRIFTKQLGHHPAWINTFRSTVPMAAMSRGHVVC